MRKTIKDIAHFFGSLSNLESTVLHVVCDSRQVQEGTLFFALAGAQVDGHQFLAEAAKKGAIAAVVCKKYSGSNFGMMLIPVLEVKQALHNLAHQVLQDRNPLVIGVTGTVGKTTTKEFIAEVLTEKFQVAKTPGNMNSQVGLPLTILNWEGHDEILVLEMGMSEKGELSRLIKIAPPELCVLTKISGVHAAFFDDLEGIAEAKCELFKSKKIKHAFLNRDTASFKSVAMIQAPKTWFGECKLQAPFSAPHLLENLGAAVTIARYLGMTEAEILKGVQKLKPFKHRGAKIEKKGVLFIDDSYNASPAAVQAALKSMPKGGNRLALFGAMKELGAMEKSSHQAVAECAFSILDELLCVGDECQPMVDFFKEKGKRAKLFASKEEATNHLKEVMAEGDVVLLKGSNSFKLWTVLEEI